MTDHHTVGGVEQPLPTPRPDLPSVQAVVRDDLAIRERVGIARYGDALKTHNGRDALLDLYQELLDGACYARQAMMERDDQAAGDQAEPVRPALLVVPFATVVQIREIGRWWSWRCILGCVYDHNCEDERTAIRETIAHLATKHGVYPAGGTR